MGSQNQAHPVAADGGDGPTAGHDTKKVKRPGCAARAVDGANTAPRARRTSIRPGADAPLIGR